MDDANEEMGWMLPSGRSWRKTKAMFGSGGSIKAVAEIIAIYF